MTRPETMAPPPPRAPSEAPPLHDVAIHHWVNTAQYQDNTYLVGFCSVDLPDATDQQVSAFNEEMTRQIAGTNVNDARSVEDWPATVQTCIEISLAQAFQHGYSPSSITVSQGSYKDWKADTTYSKLFLSPSLAQVASSAESTTWASAATEPLAALSSTQPSINLSIAAPPVPGSEVDVFSFPWAESIGRKGE